MEENQTQMPQTQPEPAAPMQAPAPQTTAPAASQPTAAPSPTHAQPEKPKSKFSVFGTDSRQLFSSSIAFNILGVWLFQSVPAIQKLLAAIAIVVCIYAITKLVKEIKEHRAGVMNYVMLVIGVFLGIFAGIGIIFG